MSGTSTSRGKIHMTICGSGKNEFQIIYIITQSSALR